MNKFTAFRLHATPGEAPERRVDQIGIDELSPGEVVVRVAYSSINYKDALASRGLNAIVRRYPRITGIDFTGTVESSADPRFRIGDEVVVHGFGVGVDHDGGHAQFARVRGDWVMPMPSGLDLFEAAAIGVAGYTAALSLHLMELNGLDPSRGQVLVTGATGGVASIAIDMLAQRGYSVVAMTGKTAERGYLTGIGAADVIGRADISPAPKPLEKAQWAGAVDSVGGATLAWLTRTMQPDGVIAAFGNAGGAELATTVLPFILRGVRLIGVVANSPMPLRQQVWNKIAREYRPAHLKTIARVIDLSELATHLDRTLAGEQRGRVVIGLAD
jgi:acrylyl-CoA reductase (NADPH)